MSPVALDAYSWPLDLLGRVHVLAVMLPAGLLLATFIAVATSKSEERSGFILSCLSAAIVIVLASIVSGYACLTYSARAVPRADQLLIEWHHWAGWSLLVPVLTAYIFARRRSATAGAIPSVGLNLAMLVALIACALCVRYGVLLSRGSQYFSSVQRLSVNPQ
ncbi:MAG: hypothetical protein K1X83_11955 [Oligoflexia bacterium]|nr:hypothetical protein [Oligoflexia bacterium]